MAKFELMVEFESRFRPLPYYVEAEKMEYKDKVLVFSSNGEVHRIVKLDYVYTVRKMGENEEESDLCLQNMDASNFL